MFLRTFNNNRKKTTNKLENQCHVLALHAIELSRQCEQREVFVLYYYCKVELITAMKKPLSLSKFHLDLKAEVGHPPFFVICHFFFPFVFLFLCFFRIFFSFFMNFSLISSSSSSCLFIFLLAKGRSRRMKL